MNEYEKQHIKKLRPYLAECTVLLRNNGDFPLEEACPIAVYGSGARQTIKGGTGSGEVNSRFFATVEKGLTRDGFTVTTKDWLDAYDQIKAQAKEKFIKEVKVQARQKHMPAVMYGMGAVMPEPDYELPLDGEGNTAIYVLSRICGEGSDRNPIAGDFKLTATEKRDILAICAKYDKFMLVLNVGGPVDLSELDEVRNILLLSQLGVETGYALGHILLGKQNPSGKLTTTWSAWEDYCTIGDFGDPDDTSYKEGIYVGYRYFDSVGKKAQFPFGFGLSYTTFSMEPAGFLTIGQKVLVSADVTNTGELAGKETLQLYVSAPQGRLDQPYQELAGFAKTKELEPGQCERKTIEINMEDLASYDPSQAAWILEEGAYIFRLGTSSTSTQIVGAVVLTGSVMTLKTRNIAGDPEFTDFRPDHVNGVTIPENTPVLTMAPEEFTTLEAEYDREYEIDPYAEVLTDEQLAKYSVGKYGDGGIGSIIGSAGKTVAGAAGETCGLLRMYGFPVLVMADGPAGLRLSRQYFMDEKGAHGSETMPESITQFLPKAVVKAMGMMAPKPKKDTEMKEQYCTAIPIGTALAQSWNPELAEICGDIVGDEMERFGVDLWLAPALNIHRSIRCGRNFEYYSEDPLISGIFAAAVTNGVQKHPGKGTTIKHFAANNQETNRYANNSRVSERALREIYLKGFGICVKKSQPLAVMTSYNLLNGTHTSEHRGLIEDVLRSEFGFEGIVMTDWIVAGSADKNAVHRQPIAAQIAAAGGDLVMPGSAKDAQSIQDSIAGSETARNQVMINVSRLYRMAKRIKNAE